MKKDTFFERDQFTINEINFVRNLTYLLFTHRAYLDRELLSWLPKKKGRKKKEEKEKYKKIIWGWYKEIVTKISDDRLELFKLILNNKRDRKKEFDFIYMFVSFYKEVALQDPLVVRYFDELRNKTEKGTPLTKKSAKCILAKLISMISGKERHVNKLSPSVLRKIVKGEIFIPKEIKTAVNQWIKAENKKSELDNSRFHQEKFEHFSKAVIPKNQCTRDNAFIWLYELGYTTPYIEKVFKEKPVGQKQIRNILHKRGVYREGNNVNICNADDFKQIIEENEIDEIFNEVQGKVKDQYSAFE